MADQLMAALSPVIHAFLEVGVEYYVGGSIACMVHGERRETSDVDVIANITQEQVKGFIANLPEGFYYADEEMIRRSIALKTNFNVIHLPTMYKVDVFVQKARKYDGVAMARRVLEIIPTQPPVEADVAQSEDIVLAKLEWYRATRESSERQWRDVLAVLKLQCFTLDFEYMAKWAKEIKIEDLLQKALVDAGIEEERE